MDAAITLNHVKVGKSYEVLRIGGTGATRRRIMDMGLTKNAQFLVRKVAPLGDPVQISLRGYELSFRKEDAKLIEVKELAE